MRESDGIYEQYADTVYKYLYRLSASAELAEELTQETFYQAVRTIGKFKGECKLSTWLCQIAKHAWYKYLGKKPKAAQVPIEDAQNELRDDNSPEKLIADEEARLSLYGDIHALKEPYKEVVLLRGTNDLSFAQIARIMGKTESWARVTFHRAKIMLIEGRKKDGN